MDSFSVVLTYDFVTKRVKLTWRDVLYAVEHHFFSPKVAIEHAKIEISKIEEFPQSLFDMAYLNKNESVHPYLDQLADLEIGQPIENIDEKWLYLILSWIFENRNKCSDPLGIVEQIYTDFNYPAQISAFIRYMPPDEADLGSPELNEARLYKKWEDYLKKQDRKYAQIKDSD